jgi:hypothetical protein
MYNNINTGGIGMKSKRLLSTIIVTAMIFGTSSSVFAAEDTKTSSTINSSEVKSSASVTVAIEQQAKISKDEAKKIAKDKLKEYMDYEFDESKFQSSVQLRPYYYDNGDEYVWDISWNLQERERNIYIQVSLSASNGKIVSMRRNEYDNKQQPSIANITKEEAKKLAEEFIKKVDSSKLNETVIVDNQYYYGGYYPVNYSFYYQRKVNGIPMEGNYINIEIDGINNKVLGFDTRWDENVKLPDTAGIKDKTAVIDIFKKAADMKLSYISSRNKYEDYSPNAQAVKLVYNSGEVTGITVDAKTGELVTYDNRVKLTTETKDLTPQEREEWLKKASTIQVGSKEIESDKAQEIMNKLVKELCGDGYKLDGIRYSEDEYDYESNGRKAWSAGFQKPQGDERYYQGGQITIDAVSGSLISIYNYNYSDKFDETIVPKVTWTQGYTTALNAIAKYFPNKMKEISTAQSHTFYKETIDGKTMPEREYYYSFPRVVNGVAYNENGITFRIDAQTGAIMDARYRWSDNIKFPAPEGVISKDEVTKLFFEKYQPELVYVSYPKNVDVYGKTTVMENKLVYRLKAVKAPYIFGNIDAITGKILDYNGQEVMEDPTKFMESIKGHKYEKELSILAMQNIIDTKDFQLDKEVTQLDLVKMLVDAKGYRPYLVAKSEALKYSNVTTADSNYKYLQMAVYYGILENTESEFIGDVKVTREEIAKVLVKLLQYENLAKATDIFTLPVEDSGDVQKENFGYVAIAKGLGILEVEGGKIRPKNNATMEELAVGIYKVLGNLRNGVY